MLVSKTRKTAAEVAIFGRLLTITALNGVLLLHATSSPPCAPRWYHRRHILHTYPAGNA
ncbi:hypothetical protein BDV27DRAFT_127584 [Aspergillus caelatus]|uniref:Uncharacterized protein n=2 Tax=Aspergillus subgen. Circumdati TaxID=2720871 RepID=A0A5N7A745_9EURO|nr:uncharacterized protein BDV27DRAFT_127584 [Aspergillus caelatus]KAE8162199.1 hypothetical protein BDV40DRAFT_265510 [Aspergillus tamarii]KAE8365036.1 hypothetical protein BDV27DRAFT_127584 [Aspergillus caelatus]